MRDPKTENFLTTGNYKWTYEPEVKIDTIDLEASRSNPGRTARVLDRDRVESYARQMARGVEFPAIVLLHNIGKTGKPNIVATGMHRLEGKIKNATQALDSYMVIEPDAYRRDYLIRNINSIEGVGLTTSEKLQHIRELHMRFPEISIAMLAADWNVHKAVAQGYIRAEEGRRRGAEHGIAFGPKVAQVSLERLNSIHSNRVFIAASEFTSFHEPSSIYVEEMCRELKGVHDEDAQLAIVARYKKDEEERSKRGRANHARTSPAPANRLLGNARQFNNQISKGVEHLFLATLADSDRNYLKILMDSTIDNARRVLTELERISSIKDAA